MYVADYSNNCVRVVSRGGVVGTLSKDGEECSTRRTASPSRGPTRRRAPPAPSASPDFPHAVLPRRHHSGGVCDPRRMRRRPPSTARGSSRLPAPNGARAILARLGAIRAHVSRRLQSNHCRALLSHVSLRARPPGASPSTRARAPSLRGDSWTGCIRTRDSRGVVSTVAGTGDAGIDAAPQLAVRRRVAARRGCGWTLLVARPADDSCVRTVALDVLQIQTGARRAVDAPRRPPPPPRPRSRGAMSTFIAVEGEHLEVGGADRRGRRGRRSRCLRPLRALSRDVHLGDARVLHLRIRPNPRRRLYRLPRAARRLLTDELAEAELTVVPSSSSR